MRELKQRQWPPQRRRQKTMIWLVECKKIIVLRMWHALEYNSLMSTTKQQREQQYRIRAKCNNRKTATTAQMLIFKWCFICHSPRGCLSSLLNLLVKPFDDTHAHVKMAPLSLETKLNNKQVESIHGKSINRLLHRKYAVQIFIHELQNFRNEWVSVANEWVPKVLQRVNKICTKHFMV